MEKEKDYFQLIYRIIIALIAVGFLTVIWPFISGVILMLVFAFLLTTVLLSFVDGLERKIKSRGLSVLAVTMAVLASIGLFIGSFIAQLSAQAKDFTNRVDQDTLTAEFKALAEKFTSAMPSFMREMQPSDSDFASTLSGFIKTVLENLTSLAGVVGNFFFMAAMSSSSPSFFWRNTTTSRKRWCSSYRTNTLRSA